MPSIVSPQDFQGENKIAQVGALPAVQQSVQWFIDKYEPLFLSALWGDALYNEYVAGIAVLPDPDQKWIDLQNNPKLKQMIVNYVYFWYMRNLTTNSVGSGEVKPENDNSRPTNSKDKQTKAWNDMQYLSVRYTLDLSIYPSYVVPHFFRYDPIYCYNYLMWPIWIRRCINEIYLPIPAGGLNI